MALGPTESRPADHKSAGRLDCVMEATLRSS